MALKARPVQDRVFVEVDQPDSNILPSGFHIVEHNPLQKRTGRVIASGPGVHNEKGQFIANTLKPGDRVLLGSYVGVEITVEGMTFKVMREADVAGLIPEDLEVAGEVMMRPRDTRSSWYNK
jgi:chaperonin GroES